MIAAAFDEAGRRDPLRERQRIFLADGNKQQLAAIKAEAEKRGLKVPVLIDYIHVSGYIGKASAALHPGDPVAAGQHDRFAVHGHGRSPAAMGDKRVPGRARTVALPPTRALQPLTRG
jgi:hypothetical protein